MHFICKKRQLKLTCVSASGKTRLFAHTVRADFVGSFSFCSHPHLGGLDKTFVLFNWWIKNFLLRGKFAFWIVSTRWDSESWFLVINWFRSPRFFSLPHFDGYTYLSNYWTYFRNITLRMRGAWPTADFSLDWSICRFRYSTGHNVISEVLIFSAFETNITRRKVISHNTRATED